MYIADKQEFNAKEEATSALFTSVNRLDHPQILSLGFQMKTVPDFVAINPISSF